MKANLTPVSSPWDSLSLLAGLDRGDVALTDAELAPHLELIEYDMFTEFDAQNLDGYLTTLAGGGLVFTAEFMAFRAAWKWDEWNHYIGYRRLMHMLTGAPEQELHQRTTSRPCDFSPMAHLLVDEFMICMVFAYDEIVTRESCAMDFDMFRSFGHENFLKWIKLVGRDEGWHLRNIINVLLSCHRDRLEEAPAILEQLITWDLQRQPYQSTFVLDHDPERFGQRVLRGCVDKVLKFLSTSQNRAHE